MILPRWSKFVVTEAELGCVVIALEAAPVPTELVAVTVKVYAVPLVSPITVIGDDVPVAVMPPGEEVTV